MSDAKTIWVTGANGFIGSEIAERLGALGHNIVGTDLEVSVCDPERLEAFAEASNPDVIINCAGLPRAALNSLGNRVKAYETNALGAGNVAVVANSIGAKFVQISTDDVFPTRMAEPANEFDMPHPEKPYGKSKRAGESIVRNSAPDHIIIRSSWVYSRKGGILKDLLDAVESGQKFEARTDQYNCPTSIRTYVNFIARAIENDATGIFHITSQGCINRYDFSAKALEICGYDPGAWIIPTTDLVTAEKVQLESLMLEMFGAELPTWEEDLRAYLEEIGLAKE